MKARVRRWNCPNCGRSNRTAVTPDANARCEYCTDVSRLEPSRPWGPRLVDYAAKVLSSLGG